jgi:hypothetical protein
LVLNLLWDTRPAHSRKCGSCPKLFDASTGWRGLPKAVAHLVKRMSPFARIYV